MIDRASLSARFLENAGWGKAAREYLSGDASDRRYERARLGAQSAVLMDAPPGTGDEPAKFLAIATHLSALGLSAPKCIDSDLRHGFLLLEDLGDGLYAKLIAQDLSLEQPLYAAAIDVLAHLQSHPAPPDVPSLTATDWATAAGFALEWYAFAITGAHTDAKDFHSVLTDLISRHADGPRVLILRDFHAENLLWLPDREGLERVGLLDFQLGQLGQPGYDVVSLLQDARRDVGVEVEMEAKARFVAAAGLDDLLFQDAYAVLGAQRALRILGVFARLCLVGAKPGYLHLIPRVWEHLQRNLAAPALAPLAKICAEVLPKPTAPALAIIGSKCGHFR